MLRENRGESNTCIVDFVNRNLIVLRLVAVVHQAISIDRILKGVYSNDYK